jgi:hypothetical protein
MHFKRQREQHGITCKKCGNHRHYWLNAKNIWQCANCRFRTTLRSGTVMQGSHLPFKKWYLAMAFMSAEKQGISAKEMQRQLRHRRYDTIWSLMHRIRNAMGNRQDQFTLEGIIQFNETYLLRAAPDGRTLKRGKRNYAKEESKKKHQPESLQTQKERPFSLHSFTKMKVHTPKNTQPCSWKSIQSFEEKLIGTSNKSPKYLNIKKHVQVETIYPNLTCLNDRNSKKSRSIINDAKQWIRSIYYRIKVKYLPLYLDEFCYRLNQMPDNKNLFDELTDTMAESYWC